jgi:hypothetical protein
MTSRDDGRRTLFVAIAAAFGLVWIYVAIRANALAFTSDEAISFRIFHGFPGAAGRANNQLLNTVLMQSSQGLFGESELALRLPNVLAFGLYTAGSLALLASLRRRTAILLGAALLLADPFLLDFFGLARGYGLSLAFAAVALGALATRTRSPLRPVLVCGGSVLAFYANFASLNLVLGVLAALGFESLLRLRSRPLAAIASLVVAVALLVPGVIRLRWLQHTHKLYYGGHTGFLHDTLRSLVEGVGYRYEHGAPWVVWGEVAVVVAAVAACMWGAYIGVTQRRWGLGQQAAVVLVVAVAAAKIEAAALHTLYPLNRTALSYVLLFAALVAGAFDDLAVTVKRASVTYALALVSTVCAVAAAVNIAYHANLRYTPAWHYDASSRQVIDAASAYERANPRAGTWRLIAGSTRWAALDYYRIRFHLKWLAPITRAGISNPRGHLYDVSVSDLPRVPTGTTLIARFPETSSELRARR